MRFSLVSHLPPILSLPSFISGRRGEEQGKGEDAIWGPTTGQACAGGSHMSEAVVGRASSAPGTVWHCASVGWANPRANPPRWVVLPSTAQTGNQRPAPRCSEMQRPSRIQATKPPPCTALTVLTRHTSRAQDVSLYTRETDLNVPEVRFKSRAVRFQMQGCGPICRGV